MNDELVWRSMFAEYEKICFMYAIKSGIFDIIKLNQPINLNELVNKTKMGKRGGSALINVLTASGYLKVHDSHYSLTDISNIYCVNDSEFTFGPMIEFYEVETKIKDAIENDKSSDLEWSIVESWNQGSVDHEMAAKFSGLMHSISLAPANYLASHINLEEKYQVKSLLDVAGGSGCYSIAFAKHQPNIKAIVLDLPAVCEVAKTFIQKASLPDESVLTFACDMFREPLPACTDPKFGYQGIFLSQIIHDWDRETNMMLLKKCFDALPSKGYIFIHEALLNDDGNGPLLVALYSFDMFLTSKGRQYKFFEVKELLLESGFVNLEVINVFGFYSLVAAQKP